MSISRRAFLRLSAGSAATLALATLAACSSAPSAPTPAVKQAAPAAGTGDKPAAPAAAPAKPAAEQPQSGGELIVGLWSESPSLDPTNSVGIGQRQLMLLFDTLVVQTADTKHHPGLAESWQVAPDGKSYTFKLKKGVKFHDGTPFNAEAVKFNLDRAVRPDVKATFSITLRGIYKSTDVVDDLTARVNLEEPFAPFLDGLAESYYGMSSPTAVQKFGQDYDRNPVGTGPFVFAERVVKSHITLKRNPDYTWGSTAFKHQGPAYLDQISFRYVPEGATRGATLETGEVHLIEEVPAEDVERFKKDPKYRIVDRVYIGGPGQLQMNTTKPPLDELPVRQAICYAVNQDELVKMMFQNVWTAAKAPTTPGTFGYDASLTKIYTPDPAKARELLEGAGWKVGSDGIRTKNGKPCLVEILAVGGEPLHTKTAELIQAQLREVGIKMEVKQLDNAAWNQTIREMNHMTVIGWRASTDPDFMRPIFHSSFIGKSQLQRSLFKDERLDKLLTDGTKELDPAKRAPLYKEAQEIIMKQALIAPLFDRFNFVGTRAQVRDLALDVRALPLLYDVWLAKS